MRTARVFAILAVLTVGEARADPTAEIRTLLPLVELQRLAIEEAGLAPRTARSWRRRVRWSGLAPTVRVRIGRGLSGYRVTAISDGNERNTVDNSESWRFEIEAAWRLDGLVFNREELRVAQEARRRAEARERLRNEVAKIYFELRRIQEAELPRFGGAQPSGEAQRNTLRLEELAARLDGLTGGAFTAQTVGK